MSGRDRLRLGVLISGRGSNMAAIARACAGGQIHAGIELVISDREGAGGLELARAAGVRATTVAARGFASRSEFEHTLGAALERSGVQLVVLAGFMRILSAEFVAAWRGCMLNIHPSLLPLHKGLHTHRRVLEAGERVHGASVHYVTEELDGGPVVLQARVPVFEGDTEDTLSARVQACEHIIYPRVIGWIASGRLMWRDGGPWLDGAPLASPVVEDHGATS